MRTFNRPIIYLCYFPSICVKVLNGIELIILYAKDNA